MRAILYEKFSEPPELITIADPSPEKTGVVVQVKATGVCRSDWHGWMGHDDDIHLPHIPGHELAGVVVEIGDGIVNWKRGDRVTVPFVGGCGVCPQCHAGDQQVCDNQFQPGFTHWGSFAEYVSIHYADLNLVALPESMNFTTAASLGCRFATAFRAVVDQGQTKPGQWVVVHGCGGVGLSAIMIANALGANTIAIDVSEEQLKLAKTLGAKIIIDANTEDVVQAVVEHTNGGAHVSLDALGNPTTCFNSISNLRKRGKHIQVGLMLAEHSKPAVPMAKVIAHELEILGSHGMQAHRYQDMMQMIESGLLNPELLVGKTISLEESIEALMNMDKFQNIGATVINRF